MLCTKILKLLSKSHLDTNLFYGAVSLCVYLQIWDILKEASTQMTLTPFNINVFQVLDFIQRFLHRLMKTITEWLTWCVFSRTLLNVSLLEGSRKLSPAQSDALLMKMRSVASEEFNMMMQRRMSQESPIQATETEFVQRLQRLTVLAVNRLIYLGRSFCSFVLTVSEYCSLTNGCLTSESLKGKWCCWLALL